MSRTSVQADVVVHRPHDRDADDDTLRLECGVCGVWGANDADASSIVALGLHALQHRGQEACGIASVHEQEFHTERHMGLVGIALRPRAGRIMIPHVV